MTTETNKALALLRKCNDLRQCSFWAASTDDDERGQAISATIMEAQEKLEAAVSLLNGETAVDKPEKEAA
jgi:DNA-binding IclR family transcriptional regulator